MILEKVAMTVENCLPEWILGEEINRWRGQGGA